METPLIGQGVIRCSMFKAGMIYETLAAMVLLMHLGFIAFAAFGGMLALRRPAMLWLHLPALAWGILMQWENWTCPLTPLENRLRERAGGAGYSGGFIEHLVMPFLYPDNLTLELRHVLALLLIGVNLAVYSGVAWRRSVLR